MIVWQSHTEDVIYLGLYTSVFCFMLALCGSVVELLQRKGKLWRGSWHLGWLLELWWRVTR